MTALAPVFAYKYDYGKQKETKNNIIVKGIEVNYKRINQDDYICLTDIARTKNRDEYKDVIKNWLRK